MDRLHSEKYVAQEYFTGGKFQKSFRVLLFEVLKNNQELCYKKINKRKKKKKEFHFLFYSSMNSSLFKMVFRSFNLLVG